MVYLDSPSKNGWSLPKQFGVMTPFSGGHEDSRCASSSNRFRSRTPRPTENAAEAPRSCLRNSPGSISGGLGNGRGARLKAVGCFDSNSLFGLNASFLSKMFGIPTNFWAFQRNGIGVLENQHDHRNGMCAILQLHGPCQKTKTKRWADSPSAIRFSYWSGFRRPQSGPCEQKKRGCGTLGRWRLFWFPEGKTWGLINFPCQTTMGNFSHAGNVILVVVLNGHPM